MVTAIRPRSRLSVLVAVGAATVACALGTGALADALEATAPTIGFLLAAVASAAAAVRMGLAAHLAGLLARGAGGRPLVLYVLVCVATAVATAATSLDGAVVLLVPVALDLAARFGAPLRPMLAGIVAVANAFSFGLPEGNPTNLIVLHRLGDTFGAFSVRALPAATAAALVCAAGVAALEHRSLLAPAGRPVTPVVPRVAGSIAAVLRLGVQLSALLVLLIPLGRHIRLPSGGGLAAALLVAGATALVAAFTNNLPASAVLAAALGGSTAYAALAGVSVGALASERGSVATILAGELAGTRAHDRRLVPVVAAALAVSVVLVWLGGR